jgi:hypothetical protein
MDTAQWLFNRLTESEKISLRGASPGAVEYMADDSFRSDLPTHPFEERVAILQQVRELAIAELRVKSQRSGFSEVTWKF